MSDTMSDIDRKKKRAILIGELFKFTTFVVVIIALGIVTFNAVISMQSRGKLYDCTTVGGECYNQSIERANRRTERLSDVVVLTAVCAEERQVVDETDRVARIRMIEQCVSKQLENEEQVHVD